LKCLVHRNVLNSNIDLKPFQQLLCLSRQGFFEVPCGVGSSRALAAAITVFSLLFRQRIVEKYRRSCLRNCLSTFLLRNRLS
jgi:hypothetical protein